MRKKFVIPVVCFALIIFNSCLHFQNNYSGVWFYTYTNGRISSEFNFTPASYFCLNPDKTYTLDFGSFKYGKWNKKGDTLILNSADDNTIVFLTNSNGKNLVLSPEPGVNCNFESVPYSFSGKKVQPFSLLDNKWRIKASHAETDAEIKSRLINHCIFWKDYFTWALDNNLETVDVRSTPTLIKIYGNGFGLKEFNDLPAAWKNYFYDSSDCIKATDILKNIFEHNDIAWAHTDNKYKMFIGAFEQLEQLLKGKKQ